MTDVEKAYIAGFLDGDGCIMAQIVRHKDYRLGFQIRVSVVFYQKSSHNEILSWLKSKLHYGYIRQRKDQMTEYTIVGLKEVKEVLILLKPFLRLKKTLAVQIVQLIDSMSKQLTPHLLIKLSRLVDETAQFNYSKKRTITTQTVLEFLKSRKLFPVET